MECKFKVGDKVLIPKNETTIAHLKKCTLGMTGEVVDIDEGLYGDKQLRIMILSFPDDCTDHEGWEVGHEIYTSHEPGYLELLPEEVTYVNEDVSELFN